MQDALNDAIPPCVVFVVDDIAARRALKPVVVGPLPFLASQTLSGDETKSGSTI